jgi:glycosyltransferase involved in cell wall biosynthesis
MLNDKNIISPKRSLVVVSNGISPYGVHFLQRVANELTNFTLRTIYTYEISIGHWQITLPPSINAVILGKGEEVTTVARGIAAFRNGWARGRHLMREIKKSCPSAVMIFGYFPAAHFLAIEWCHWNGIPCLMFSDSNILGDRNKGLKAWIKKLIVSRAVSQCKALLPCGKLGGQYFQKYGARPEQIFFVPYEPDYSLIEDPSPVIIQSLAAEFRLDPARRRFLFSGRFIAVKRIDLLIDAFSQLADKLANWDLLIAGGGPLEAELKARVPSRLQQRIVWTGYLSSPQRMSALYKLADVLVLPSDYEPWALVVNEAACAGLALVCSDVVGAAAELLHDHENGRLFRTGDLASLVDAMLDVTNDANLCLYQAASLQVLKNWRRTADPIEGFRRALDFCLWPRTMARN